MLGYYHLVFIGLPFGIRNVLILKTTMSSYTLDGDKELDNNKISVKSACRFDGNLIYQ